MNDMEVKDVASMSGVEMVDVSWNRYADMISPFAMILSIAMTLALR